MNKRKLMLVAIALCMAAILLAGGTLAYLTDTDNAVNTFTAGKVGLTLDENIPVKNETTGDLEKGTERTEGNQTYHVYPGNTVAKDPTITMDSDTEEAWVAAKIVVKGNLKALIGGSGDTIDITKIVSGGLVGEGTAAAGKYNGLEGHTTDDCFIYQVVNTVDVLDNPDTADVDEDLNAKGEWTIYVFMYAKQTKESAPIVLFDTMEIPAEWDNAEMAKFNDSTIDITAYAVQADGFADAYEAMTTAFNVDGDVVFPAN